ncbi:MAG TPA: hypothetical protein VIV65_01345, partial [Gemmatimonadaceae bacterium]
MSRVRMLAVASIVLCSANAGAQNACPSCTDSVTGQWHMLPALGLRAGSPQKVSAALGIVTGRNYAERGHTEDATLY